MKRYIIISALLVSALGLTAQTTDRGGRTAPASTTKSTVEENKSTSVNSETRTREVAPSNNESPNRETAPVRTNTNTERWEEAPARTTPAERRPEPVYNESRNRETPAVRTTTTTRTVETRTEENSYSAPNTNNSETITRTTEERPRTSTTVSQDRQRPTGSTTNNGREAGRRTSETVRPQTGDRSTGNTREVNVERKREYVPRTEQVYVEKRQAYRTPERPRTVRTVNQSTTFVHRPIEYRRNYYPYAEPRRVEIIWDVHMYNEYSYLYPHYDYWYYPYGYRIHTISAYDADRYIGEIARIYGRVSDVWYERKTDEYYLFFGEPYPYQDFSVIITGKTARRYSYRPERYFVNRNIAVTGLVSMWDNRPEMLVKKRSQIEVYF